MSTTALYKALIHANVPEDLAEKAVEDLPHAESLLTQAEFHNEMKELRIALEKYATKEQLDTTKEQLDTKLDQLRTELKADSTEAQVHLIKWMVGLTIALIGVMVGLFGVFLGGLGSP